MSHIGDGRKEELRLHTDVHPGFGREGFWFFRIRRSRFFRSCRRHFIEHHLSFNGKGLIVQLVVVAAHMHSDELTPGQPAVGKHRIEIEVFQNIIFVYARPAPRRVFVEKHRCGVKFLGAGKSRLHGEFPNVICRCLICPDLSYCQPILVVRCCPRIGIPGKIVVAVKSSVHVVPPIAVLPVLIVGRTGGLIGRIHIGRNPVGDDSFRIPEGFVE